MYAYVYMSACVLACVRACTCLCRDDGIVHASYPASRANLPLLRIDECCHVLGRAVGVDVRHIAELECVRHERVSLVHLVQDSSPGDVVCLVCVCVSSSRGAPRGV